MMSGGNQILINHFRPQILDIKQEKTLIIKEQMWFYYKPNIH